MFTSPQLPPKDYYLQKINQNQLSCQEHTPWSLPRVTLPTIGHFCAPIPYGEKDRFDEVKIEEPHPLLVDKWTDNRRAEWLIKPGTDDYMVHDIFKNYTLKDQPNYKTKYKKAIFPRPYRYEINSENGMKLTDTNEETYRRWQEEPDFSTQNQADPSQRKQDLALVGSCFKNKMINWYYHNYPPPKIRPITKSLL